MLVSRRNKYRWDNSGQDNSSQEISRLDNYKWNKFRWDNFIRENSQQDNSIQDHYK